MEFESTDNIAMVYEIIKNDLEPLKKAIQLFKDQLFQDKKD